MRLATVGLHSCGAFAMAAAGRGVVTAGAATDPDAGHAPLLEQMQPGPADGVRLGVQTYSFREMLTTRGDMTDKMIAAMRQLSLTECEMFEPCLQPRHLSTGSPEALRNWRLGAGLDDIRAHAAKLRNAGIRVYAFNFGLGDACSDAEIERGMQMTHALGAQIMSASTTLTMAKRSIPFFENSGLLLALHGHSDLSDPNQFATPASFEAGLAFSPQYRVNLDIGHFFAAGFDPVDFIQAHHGQISHLHLKDRKRNNGPNMPFGQGDTPIGPVLLLLKREHYPIPAYIEYEYAGACTSVEEVAICLDYVQALLSPSVNLPSMRMKATRQFLPERLAQA